MKYHKTVNVCIRVFLVIEAILYLTFTYCDIFLYSERISSPLKFISISLCFVFALARLVLYVLSKDKNLSPNDMFNQNCIINDCRILVRAFLFTVIADVFLLFTDQYQMGVLCFCLVQLIYLYRIQTIQKVKIVVHLLLRLVVSIVIVILLYGLKLNLDFLLCITVFYFINFVGNIALLCGVWSNKRSTEKNNRTEHMNPENYYVNVPLFLLGLVLFVLCDISVGIYNLTYYIDLSGSVYKIIEEIAAFGMWGFYLPGQICIALSTKKKQLFLHSTF